MVRHLHEPCREVHRRPDQGVLAPLITAVHAAKHLAGGHSNRDWARQLAQFLVKG